MGDGDGEMGTRMVAGTGTGMGMAAGITSGPTLGVMILGVIAAAVAAVDTSKQCDGCRVDWSSKT